jgi:hypothetical protein
MLMTSWMKFWLPRGLNLWTELWLVPCRLWLCLDKFETWSRVFDIIASFKQNRPSSHGSLSPICRSLRCPSFVVLSHSLLFDAALVQPPSALHDGRCTATPRYDAVVLALLAAHLAQ